MGARTAMKFTVKNTALQAGAPPARVVTIRAYLDGMPDGELLTYRELQARMRVGRGYISDAKAHPLMADYGTLALVDSKHKVLFGNPRTIAAYNKEFK